MKVLQIIQKPQLRGAEIFACQLSQELANKGVTVDVICLFDNGSPDFPFAFKSLNANQRRRFFDIAAYRRLAAIIRDGNYDVVQANAGDTLKYAVFSRYFFRWKAKLVFRNANRMTGFMSSFLHRSFNRWLLSKCDFFISVSDNSRTDLISLYPAATRNSITIPIGTYPVDDKGTFTRNVPAGEAVLVSVGSFVPEKNHLFLIDVFRQFYTETGKGYLWLIGDGKLRADLEDKVRKVGLVDRVKFWGYRKDVLSLLKMSDVLVMPSRIEGLPAVIVEAIACDVPVIASDAGGIPEIIETNKTGICIRGENVSEYVAALLKVLDEKEFRRNIVANARMKFLEGFTLEKIGDRFLKKYRELGGMR